jgi:hypothetical protein
MIISYTEPKNNKIVLYEMSNQNDASNIVHSCLIGVY